MKDGEKSNKCGFNQETCTHGYPLANVKQTGDGTGSVAHFSICLDEMRTF